MGKVRRAEIWCNEKKNEKVIPESGEQIFYSINANLLYALVRCVVWEWYMNNKW